MNSHTEGSQSAFGMIRSTKSVGRKRSAYSAFEAPDQEFNPDGDVNMNDNDVNTDKDEKENEETDRSRHFASSANEIPCMREEPALLFERYWKFTEGLLSEYPSADYVDVTMSALDTMAKKTDPSKINDTPKEEDVRTAIVEESIRRGYKLTGTPEERLKYGF